MIFPANLLTGTKHPAFLTSHLTDIDKTTHNYSQQHKNLNNYARKPLRYTQIKPNETKEWLWGFLHHQARKPDRV